MRTDRHTVTNGVVRCYARSRLTYAGAFVSDLS